MNKNIFIFKQRLAKVYTVSNYGLYIIKHACSTWSEHVLHVFDNEVKA